MSGEALAQAVAAQRQGADPRASAFVSANAGSGKTRVLVDRVARLLLSGAPPARVLCLTFTKAAATEMQDRLYQRLGDWAIAPDETLREALADLTGGAPADPGLARRLFARALDTPGGLNVQTIHAFCERLLRNFPVEAGLDPGFTVLEEGDAARLATEARRDVALAARRDPHGEAARAFEGLAAARSDQSADAAFGWVTLNRHALSDLFGRVGLDGAVRALRAKLDLAPDATSDSIMAQAWAETPKDRLRAAARAMESGSGRDQERAARLHAALDEADPAIAWPLYFGAVRTQKGERFSGGLCTKGVADSHPDIADMFGAKDAPGDECTRIDAVQAQLKGARCADLSAAALTLAHAFIAAYEARKRRLRALDFADLIHHTRTLLKDSAARDWVRYKLDGGVDHVLVDEAQDNSAEQWDIVDETAQEFFSGTGAEHDLRTLFAVGDEKQSIFSFQGADPGLFRLKGRDYAARAHDAGLTFHAPPLETSFRSAPNILSAVDAVFGSAETMARMFALTGEEDESGRAFQEEKMRHAAHRDDRPGVVELWPTLPAADAADDGDPAAPVDAPPPDDPKSALAQMIARRIRDMIDAGASVRGADGARPMRAGDALILVRRRGPFFEEMIRQLKLAGLPVAGADRMTLTEQTAVKDLLALGRFALLPEDDLSLAELLRSPLFQPAGGEAVITEDALFDLAWREDGRKRPLWDELRETEDARFAETKAVLGDVLASVGVAAPYEFFAGVLNRLAPEGASFARRLFSRLGPEAEDPVEEFLARALAHQRRGAPTLQRFVAEIEADSAQIKREMEAARDEVRVMTVHGAKGLEAPIVFLPDTTAYKKRPGERGLFADDECGLIWSPTAGDDPPAAAELRARRDAKDDAEYLRLLYVALTRARDHLIVAGWRMGPRGAKNPIGRVDEGCWHDLVAAGLAGAGAEPLPFATPSGEDAGEGLILGSPPAALERTGAGRAAASLPEWTRQTLEAEGPARFAAPSRLLDDAGETAAVLSPLSRAREARYARGSLIHKLLETLPDLAPERRGDAARAYLAAQADLDDTQRTAIAAETLAVLDHKEFAALFGPDSLAEVSLTGSAPGLPDGVILNGQVDRLVVTDHEVLIVDYKTNRPPPKDAKDVPRLYLAQMAAYQALLRSIHPGKPVRCLLLWTDGPNLMELEDAALAGALAAGVKA